MKISALRELLDNFDDDSEVCITIDFPDFKDWAIASYDIGVGINSEYGGLELQTSIRTADFDYPAILRELKDLAAAIPEEICTPK